MSIRTATMEEKLHRAMVAWQEKHFKDYFYLLENWSKFYKQAPFRLCAKFQDLKEHAIEVGAHKGDEKFKRTKGMDAETLERARAIIRAQTSTELGSIQQHKAQDPKLQFDVLRIMAEEYRHGYQMLFLLADDDWGGNVAHDTIDELLSMETGSHVLDAFNVYFDSFVDNIVFAAVIDRVGKYQLTMQKVFAYAPMAESMTPMLSEEAFHLASGVNPLKQWVRDAVADKGNVSVANIQRHLNKWIPRGLEMFGDERGGEANVRLGLKDLNNEQSSARYHAECKTEVVDVLNAEIVRAKSGKEMPADEAAATADRILHTHEGWEGVKPEDLLTTPARSFFRRRGVHAFQMNAASGKAMKDVEAYVRHLRAALPEAYVCGKDFSTYVENLRKHNSGEKVEEKGLPFYG